MTHISSRLAVFVFLLCSSARCFAAPGVLSLRSIDLDGAVDDADISPDGKYLAAAVRVCKRLGQSRTNTCTHYIRVWSFGDTKLVANRTLFPDVKGDLLVALRFSADGRTLVISDGQGKLRVWQTSDLAETTSIDLGFVSDEVRQLEAQDAEEFARFREETKLAQPSPRVEQIAASPSSPLVAAVVRVGHWAAVVQVFDLTSGKLLRSWSFLDAATYFGGPPLAWAQDGKRVAVSLPSTRGSKETGRPDPADLLIYDVNSGQLTAKFETEEEMERNVLAGARKGTAVFAGDEVIVSTRRFPGTSLGLRCGCSTPGLGRPFGR